jgi:osmotically-inducible protein OsmY
MTISAYSTTVPAALSEAAERALQQSPYFFLRRVRVSTVGKTLFLRGAVPTQRLSDIADAIVSRIDGIDGVVNCLEVAQGTVISATAGRQMRIAG